MDSATAGQGLDGSAPGKQHVLQAVVSLWLILRGRPHRDDGKEKGAKENQMRRPNVKYYLSQLTDPVPSQPCSPPPPPCYKLHPAAPAELRSRAVNAVAV